MPPAVRDADLDGGSRRGAGRITDDRGSGQDLVGTNRDARTARLGSVDGGDDGGNTWNHLRGDLRGVLGGGGPDRRYRAEPFTFEDTDHAEQCNRGNRADRARSHREDEIATPVSGWGRRRCRLGSRCGE